MSYKILIVVSEFNRRVSESLLAAATETLYKNGFESSQLKIVWVPGAFELPLAAAKGARSGKWDSVICLGCVIQGETKHFDYVCSEAARGIMQVSLETEKPVIFGVLTTNNSKQALERSGLSSSEACKKSDGVKRLVENKGIDAAEAALKMLETMKELEG